jgi:hypothetical protein
MILPWESKYLTCLFSLTQLETVRLSLHTLPSRLPQKGGTEEELGIFAPTTSPFSACEHASGSRCPPGSRRETGGQGERLKVGDWVPVGDGGWQLY